MVRKVTQAERKAKKRERKAKEAERTVLVLPGPPTTFHPFSGLPKELQTYIFSFNVESCVKTPEAIWSLRAPKVTPERNLFDIRPQGPDSSFFLTFSLSNMCLGQDLRCREGHLPAGLRVSVLGRQATLGELWKLYNSDLPGPEMTKLTETCIQTRKVELIHIRV